MFLVEGVFTGGQQSTVKLAAPGAELQGVDVMLQLPFSL